MLKVNELNKKVTGSNPKNKSQNQPTMKKIEVLKNGETKVHEVRMTKKQKFDYAENVLQCLFGMSERWQWKTNYNNTNPTYQGIFKAAAHVEEILETEKDDIPMAFAFTHPEHCAIYFALCFGAFNCADLHEVSEGATLAAVAMLKVLTSRKARTEILEG